MFQPLLTRLMPPQANPSQIRRSDLLRQLVEGVGQARLTLISAQAGAGKTTLLGQWAAQAAHTLEIIWLTLDKSDNDPGRFWGYVIAAFNNRFPGLNQVSQPLLEMLQLPSLVSQPVPVETILVELINAVLRLPDTGLKNICLILDDYHLIENKDIHQAMVAFLDFLPPSLHLLIASRSDPELPLARLRARGELLELRAENLRFNQAEAATFYNEKLYLGLSQAQITTLQNRTEGWAAGMHLLALSLRNLPDGERENFIQSFNGTNRYIIDYLAQEILEHLPESTQQFLLQTSILEKLQSELCEAVVSSRLDSNEPGLALEGGQVMLDKLATANLFIHRLDEQGEWYRYHPLFAAVLQNRLAKTYPLAFRQTLHRRAAHWFSRQGQSEEAVKHLFAARLYSEAAALLHTSQAEWWQRGEMLSLVGWIEKLPEQVRKHYPLLELTRAWPVVLTAQVERVHQILHGLEASFNSPEPPDPESLGQSPPLAGDPQVLKPVIVAQLNFLKGYLALVSTRWDEAIGFLEGVAADGAENRLSAGPLPWWLLALTSLGWAYRFTGRFAEARKVYSSTSELCLAQGDFAALAGCLSYQLELEIETGQLRQAARHYREAIRQGQEKLGTGLAQVYLSGLYAGLGRIYYEWNELAEAEKWLNQALYYSRLDQNLPIIVAALEGLAKVALAQGDQARAYAFIAEMQAEAAPEQLEGLRHNIEAFQAQFLLRQGRLAQALAWAEALRRHNPDYQKLPPIHLREIRLLTLAKVWLATGQSEAALALLDRLLETALDSGQHHNALQIYLLQTLALYPRPQFSEPLERALALAAPENYVRLFLDEGQPALTLLQTIPPSHPYFDFTARLIAVFEPILTVEAVGPTRAQAIPRLLAQGSFEPLSEREKEVLGGLAQGFSNRVLAEKLVVTENTVKVHIRNIFGKLEVNSRTQALVRARELGLL